MSQDADAPRAWEDFDTGRAMTCLGGLLAGDAALALLCRSMSRREETMGGTV